MYEKTITRLQNKDYQLFDVVMKKRDDEKAFHTVTVDGDINSKCAVIYGDNASGKSLIASLMELQLKDDGIYSRSANMRNRTSSGIERAMVFGDESSSSTGAMSLKVAIKSMKATAAAGKPAVSILDEPDIGLSPYYARAFGEHIANEYNAMDDDKGLIMVSHSTELMQNFLDGLDKPYVAIGINTDKSLAEWMANEESATIEELLDLYDYSREKEFSITNQLKN